MIEEIKKTKRNHQAAIHTQLNGNVHYQKESPTFDFPLCLLAFTNRSGSNLLAEYLAATKLFCGFQESLNYETVKHVCERNDIQTFPEYFEHITRTHKEEGRYFFIKSSWDQFLMLREWNVLGMFSGLKIVYIERLNYINQAISYVIANQTKQWTIFQRREKEQVHYDYSTIESVISANAKSNRIFRYLFEVLDVGYSYVVYEELVKDPQGSMRKIHDYFGHPQSPALPSGFEPRLKVQSGDLNREFKSRYLQQSLARLEA